MGKAKDRPSCSPLLVDSNSILSNRSQYEYHEPSPIPDAERCSIELSSTAPSTQEIIRVFKISAPPELLQLAGHDARHESLTHKNVMVTMAPENPGSAGPKRNHHFVADLQDPGPNAEMLIFRFEKHSLVARVGRARDPWNFMSRAAAAMRRSFRPGGFFEDSELNCHCELQVLQECLPLWQPVALYHFSVR